MEKSSESIDVIQELVLLFPSHGLTFKLMSPTTKFLYAFLSVVSQLIAALLLGSAVLPAFNFVRRSLSVLASSMYTVGGALLFCLSLGLAFVIFGNTLLLLVIAVRTVFRIRSFERRGQLFSLAVLGSLLYNLLIQLATLFYLPLLRSSALIVWFYRGMGARIGAGTVIATTRLWDCDLIEIGEDCMIGGQCFHRRARHQWIPRPTEARAHRFACHHRRQ